MRWAQFALLPPPVLQANRHHHTSLRGSELSASQGIHTDKCWYCFPDQKAESGMTVNNQPPKAYLQSLQLK